MEIEELFEMLLENFSDDELHGDFQIVNNKIIWSCELGGELNCVNNSSYDDDDVFSFESTTLEEELIVNYLDDLELINVYIDTIGEADNWEIEDYNINNNIISFEIH